MFQGCKNITEINLSNFNTSNVTSMISMFSYCSNLTSLNLSNFDTTRVTDMGNMFYGCTNLKSLNLSNFDASNVTNMNSMFYSCTNLNYINLNNFTEKKRLDITNIFYGVPDNMVVCLSKNSSKIFSVIKDKKCYSIDCSDDWEIEQKRIVNKNDMCIDNSDKNISYKYEYKGKYYEECRNGNLINNSTIKSCTCDEEKCSECPNEPLKDLCLKCNDDYYAIENDNNKYVICSNNTIGYYLDNNIYKKCYYTCKECEIKGNNDEHNCIKCNDNYSFEININKYSNCYKNCTYYHYFDDNNNYHCTNNFSCPNEYPKLIPNKMECIKNNKIKNLIENIMIKNDTKEITKKEEIEYYDTILDTIENWFTLENYDTRDLDNGKEEVIETEKVKIIITTTDNQKNNENSNMISIDLEECESLLRNHYNLTNNDTLYLKIIEILQEGMKIPKVEYDIYSRLLGLNLEKLNKSVCANSKISLYIHIVINDNLDKLDSNSGYYNDICYTTTSESGTDISLKDRKNEYINNTVCQEDCDFSGYNSTSQKAKCSCKVKESSSSFYDMNIDKKKLLSNFKDIKNVANLKILKCNEILFSKEGLSKNFGFYVLLFIILFLLISTFFFFIKQSNELWKKIEDIANIIKDLVSSKKENKDEKEETKNEENKMHKNEIQFGKIDDISNDLDKKKNIKTMFNKKKSKRKKKEKKEKKEII